MKLNYEHHYFNTKTKEHYYHEEIFTDIEWNKYIHDEKVKNNLHIGIASKWRLPPEQCDRWYNVDNSKTKIVQHCPNKPFYRSKTGVYLCKFCAREVAKINNKAEFVKIIKND